MGVAHAQLDGHVGGDDVRQVGDVAGTGGTHLQDKVARRLVGQQHRQGQANLVVERELGGDRRPVLAHDLEQQVLRGRLTDGSRHRDDIQVTATAQLLDVSARQRPQRLGRILDDDLGHGLVDLVLDDDGDCAARCRTGHEGMTVGALTAARNVERPCLSLARIRHHGPRHGNIIPHEATRYCLSDPLG